MDDYFIIEEHSPLLTSGEPFDLAVTAVGHCRVPNGPILAPEISTYAGIAWCIAGDMETYVDDVPSQYRAAQVFVIPPGVTHYSCVLSEAAEFRFFAIEGPRAWEMVLEMGLWEGVFNAGEALVEWFDFLLEKMPRGDSSSLGMNLSRGRDLVGYIATNNRKNAPDKLAVDIETILRRDWNNPELNVDYVLSKLDIHRSTASTKFKKRTGQTIIDYLNSIRITEAKRLLHNTRLPVKQIAQDCGFADPLYFSRIFTKKEKISPKKFRDQ